MSDTNPNNIEFYLKDSRFPADKKDLVEFAKNHHAPDSIIQQIGKIPDGQYQSLSEASKALDKGRSYQKPMGLDSCDD